MVRERRQSYFLASERIAAHAALSTSLLQSSGTDRPQVQSPERASARLRARNTNVASSCNVKGIIDHAIEKRQARSNRTKRGASQLINHHDQINVDEMQSSDIVNVLQSQIQCRNLEVRLNRLSDETIQFHLGVRQSQPQQRNQTMSQSRVCSIQTAKKIMNRRYTVHVEQMDFSEYRSQPSVVDSGIEIQMSQDPPLHEPPSQEPSVSQQPNDVILPSLNEQNNMQDEVTTFYDTDSDKSSEISNQDVNFQMLPISQPVVRLSYLDARQINAHEKMVYQADMDTASRSSNSSEESLDRTDLIADADDERDDTSTPYYEVATQFSEVPIPAALTTQQLQTSQLTHHVPWAIDRSMSSENHSVAADYTTSSNERTIEAGQKNFFIDSPHISYGSKIQYKAATFAVNCFDHNDQSIRNHFISKFSRSYLVALSANFRGDVWATDTTVRLIRKYSNIDVDRLRVMEYDKPVTIEDATVTAFETPNFPGGALFLFEAENEKRILHVGDLRLSTDVVEANIALMNRQIDMIRCDKSILSRLFYSRLRYSDPTVELLDEIHEFIETSRKSGLKYLIAVGVFEIGMESFVYKLASNFTLNIYMNEERRQFLKDMESGDDSDSLIQKLLKMTEKNTSARIHVLQVEEISEAFLTHYVYKHNFHCVMGIRPRGCDIVPQTIFNRTHKIVDIANPLVGDMIEYDRFIAYIQNDIPRPSDHGDQNQVTKN